MTAPSTAIFGFRRRTPVLRQSQAAECGIACLAMIAGYHGHRIDLPALRRKFDVSMKGMTLVDVIGVAQAMNLEAHPVRLEIEELQKLRLPCILHWSFNHFVVLERLRGDRAIIHDPARGYRAMRMSDISRHFTGVAVEFWPNVDFRQCNETQSLKLADMFRGIAGLPASIAHILMLSACLEVFLLLSPIGFQIVIDQAIVGLDQGLLGLVAMALAFFVILQSLLSLVRSWSILVLQTGLSMQSSSGLFDHLSDLPLAYFEKRHTGDIVSRFGSLGTIQQSLTTELVRSVLDGIMIIGILTMMVVYGGPLVGVVMLTTAAYVALRFSLYGPYRRASEDEIAARAQQQSHFLETIRGMASVKSLGLRHKRRSAWGRLLSDAINARLRYQKLDALFAAANRMIFGIDRIALIVLGALAVMKGTLTVGMLIAFLAYRDQFAARIVALVSTVLGLRMLAIHKERLSDIVLTEREDGDLAPRPDDTARMFPAMDIDLRDVGFRYGDGTPAVLSDLNMRVEEGECIALVGPSGCGKTTALHVLAGLAEPTQGDVLVGGCQLSKANLAAYRSNIACVLQDDHLFSGSLAENIAAFDENLEWERVIDCARAAAIDPDIRQMPMGYETLVGDMGSVLSGGQKQRLLLARALYRRPRILFLDEATSHLDETNERLINNALRNLNITRIMVAHRQSTIALADRVIALGTRPQRVRQTA